MPLEPSKPQPDEHDAQTPEAAPDSSGSSSVTTTSTASCRDGPRYAPSDYAGFLRRSAALLIDGLLCVVPYAIIPELWYEFAPDPWVTIEVYAWFELAAVAIFLCYNLGLRLTTGGTLGYRIVGIRYAYALGGKPPLYLMAYRSAIAVFLLWSFGLDHFWILFDGHKQAWHDKLSGFYVVKRRAQPCGTRRIVRRVINFMMMSFVVWEPAEDEVPVVASSTDGR